LKGKGEGGVGAYLVIVVSDTSIVEEPVSTVLSEVSVNEEPEAVQLLSAASVTVTTEVLVLRT
jgi:ribosomal protein L12E/L44/L45/RPP1/RPP2